MTSTSPPTILFTSGIAIGPADLDFGTASTQPQINALSSFSQLVNAIPAASAAWVPTGSLTWSVYGLVLSMAEFAQPIAAPAAAMMVGEPEPDPGDEMASTANGEASAASAAAVASMLSGLHERLAPTLRDIGFELAPANENRIESRSDDPTALAAAPAAASNGLSALFVQLKAQLAIDALTDTMGSQFYPTYPYPADFYQSQYDASWQPFTITPGQNDPWAPVAQGGTVSGEMITVPLQRAWWSTWVFESRGWRFDPAAGMPVLSDGGSPPQGTMPLYASALTLARKIVVIPGKKAAGAPAATTESVKPFTLRSDVATNVAPSAASASNPDSDPSSMTIIGFTCTTLPKCPNPDDSLHWG